MGKDWLRLFSITALLYVPLLSPSDVWLTED